MDSNEDGSMADAGTLLYDGGKRCSLFVVDVGDAMFAGDEQQLRIRLALKTIRDRVNYLCCTGGLNELASILFINTSITNKDAENVDCIFVRRPIETMDAEFVKELDVLLAAERPRDALTPVLGADSGTCNWSELMFLCQRMLTYSGVALRRRQVFFFTVNGDPTSGDERIARAVRSYVGDLRAKDTQLSVCLVDLAARELAADEGDLPDDQPDADPIHPFWMEIDENVEQSSSLLRLQNEVMRKDVGMRATASIPMRLGGAETGVTLAVGVYCLIREQRRPTAIPLDADTNEVLESRVHYVADEEGAMATAAGEDGQEERFEGDINFSGRIGGETVVLNRAELEGLRRFDSPGLTVIGFKPLKCLKHSHRLGPSKYVYPLEEAIGGSATLYRALLQRCAERELFILARYTEKLNTPPQLVALTPQRRMNDGSTIDDSRYDGFHLIELPFAEDKRPMEERLRATAGGRDEVPVPSAARLKTVKEFVRRLTARYAPHQFTNPVLQRFYSGLEAMALDLDIEQLKSNPRMFDKIRPYYEDPMSLRRAASQIDQLKHTFPDCVVGRATEDIAPKRRGRAPTVSQPPSSSCAATPAKRGRRKKD